MLKLVNYFIIGGNYYGKKPKLVSLNDQLKKITNEIENMENSINRLKLTKNELEERIKQIKLSELEDIIKEKGLTFDQVKELLQNNQNIDIDV